MLGIVSIRAVTRELMSGRLKVIEVEGFRAERMFAFAEPQGQNGEWKRASSDMPAKTGDNLMLYSIKIY